MRLKTDVWARDREIHHFVNEKTWMLKTNIKFLLPAAGSALATFTFFRFFPEGTPAHWEILVAGLGAASGVVMANLLLR